MKYTTSALNGLQALFPDVPIIIEYPDKYGNKAHGPMLTAYTSKTGTECVTVTNFATSIPCAKITGHWFNK